MVPLSASPPGAKLADRRPDLVVRSPHSRHENALPNCGARLSQGCIKAPNGERKVGDPIATEAWWGNLGPGFYVSRRWTKNEPAFPEPQGRRATRSGVAACVAETTPVGPRVARPSCSPLHSGSLSRGRCSSALRRGRPCSLGAGHAWTRTPSPGDHPRGHNCRGMCCRRSALVVWYIVVRALDNACASGDNEAVAPPEPRRFIFDAEPGIRGG
jgi:hypothetical protein